MGGPGEYYAKWNKPGGERQTPHDLTNKWNLINKTNKQAKYNQRHWNKEQTESKQRGVGRGMTRKRMERVFKEHVKRKHGQSQSGEGLRVRGGDEGGSGGGEMETTVHEQQ